MLALALPGVDLSGGHAGHSKTIDSIARVAVLDATTGALIASRVLDAPNHNAIFTPDGRELWTALSTSPGKILVLDASSLEEIEEIPVGDAPREITFSSDGRFAFVANGESNDVSVIDPATRRVVGEIAVGEGPVGAWPGGDGFMYVDNEGSRTISAVDEASHEVVRTYALGFTPGFAAVSTSGELWVTDPLRGRVVFHAAGSDEIAGDVVTGIGAHAIAFSADGARGFVTNQDAASVSVVDVATKSVLTQILVGRKPNGLVYRAR
jgi:YVTN family beta-propeller protein